MKYLSQSKYEKRMAELKKRNEIAKQKNELKAEKNRLKKKPTTSKLLLVAVVILCVEIVIFSQYVMIKFQDLTALYTLIGVPVTLVPVALGYYYKAKSENTIGGLTYRQMEIDNGIDVNTPNECIDVNVNENGVDEVSASGEYENVSEPSTEDGQIEINV